MTYESCVSYNLFVFIHKLSNSGGYSKPEGSLKIPCTNAPGWKPSIFRAVAGYEVLLITGRPVEATSQSKTTSRPI